MADATVSTGLSSDEIKQINNILRNTPISALPQGGYRAVKTVSDVIENLDEITGYLKFEMGKHEDARDELDKLKRDLSAAGRIFKIIQDGQSS